ncbi:copper resistance D family protein [Trujillonella endophytica]|uniref:Putative copper resistance protein D n=1 Tax=Trujillonella endophytica TaxID=673521 RepID=A0A1H8VRA5_9ACTN|nr:CopD family protein [Trujillella endophytica]SEP17864.1 putative copper resistance protein D [Trujillella endophytica]
MTALLLRPAPVVESAPPRRSRAALGLAAGLGLGAVLVLALVVGGAAPAPAAAGLTAPGALVDWGLPVAALAVRISALGTIGTLLFAAVLLPGRVLPAAARRAVRATSRWAAVWAVAVVVQAVLGLARLVGVPPQELTAESARVFLTHLPAGDAALGAAGAAVVVALSARRCTGSGAAMLLLLVAGAGVVLPVVLTGHSAAAEDHLLATAILAVHVTAACVWVGGLLAVLVHGRTAADLPRVAGRFSAVALGAATAVGASGLLAAWSVLDDGPGLLAGLGSGYGLLLIGKTAALVALLAFGRHHRRCTLPALREGRSGGFRRFAAVEGGVMLATVALAVALAASPPPATPPAIPTATSGPAATAGPVEDFTPPPGHDHGDLSVPVLVDPTGFTVTEPVPAGAVVTVHNPTDDDDVTVTADDGSFDAVIPSGSLTSFPAPDRPGSYPFGSRRTPGFTGVLVVF